MKLYLVYKLSLENQRFYIGVTSNINRRLDKHKSENRIINGVDILYSTFNKADAYSLERIEIDKHINNARCINNFKIRNNQESTRKYKIRVLDAIMTKYNHNISEISNLDKQKATLLLNDLYGHCVNKHLKEI